MDWDRPQYRLSEAAAASGWPINTVRDYFSRGVFPWKGGDQTADVAGSTALLTLRSVVRLAVARQIWICCQRPKEAFLAALSFTDVGSGSKFEVSRLPGDLFPLPYRTVLAFRPGANAEVQPIERGQVFDVDSLTTAPFPSKGPVIVLEVNPVLETVLRVLGVEQPSS